MFPRSNAPPTTIITWRHCQQRVIIPDLQNPTYRACAEEKLVEAEHNLRQNRGSRRWSRHNIFQAEIRKCPDERTSVAGICQRITPEDPLEGCPSHSVSDNKNLPPRLQENLEHTRLQS